MTHTSFAKTSKASGWGGGQRHTWAVSVLQSFPELDTFGTMHLTCIRAHMMCYHRDGDFLFMSLLDFQIPRLYTQLKVILCFLLNNKWESALRRPYQMTHWGTSLNLLLFDYGDLILGLMGDDLSGGGVCISSRVHPNTKSFCTFGSVNAPCLRWVGLWRSAALH